MSSVKPHDYRDPNDPHNSAEYHTGNSCIEPGCDDPSGTWWSHLWCFKHNVERMNRISAAFEDLTHE